MSELNSAVQALNQGDPEPLVALIDEGSKWRGIARGHLWWRQVPACHGPTEAREMLRLLLHRRDGRAVPIVPEFTQVGDKVIGSAPWAAADGGRQQRFMVLSFRDGKIIDMQACASRREAERFAKRH